MASTPSTYLGRHRRAKHQQLAGGPGNQTLLTGGSAQVFNSGQIGGPVGSVDQTLAAGADLVGLFTGQ